MSMYLACRYCGEDSTVESNFTVCANPEHVALAKMAAQLSFDATPKWPEQRRQEVGRILAREIGLSEDCFLKEVLNV
ncbi:MAG: hypothetical protein HYV65_03350 [Candidatus Spechtbacteria bacterium]|nr:hypothetical protein [Candidatus Spechtbacteria bacterium]